MNLFNYSAIYIHKNINTINILNTFYIGIYLKYKWKKFIFNWKNAFIDFIIYLYLIFFFYFIYDILKALQITIAKKTVLVISKIYVNYSKLNAVAKSPRPGLLVKSVIWLFIVNINELFIIILYDILYKSYNYFVIFKK